MVEVYRCSTPTPATPKTHISAPDAGNLITVMEYQEVN
jgi:hypothetical protein